MASPAPVLPDPSRCATDTCNSAQYGNRIFVGNLQGCSESELRSYFEDSFGPLSHIFVVRDKFAFCTFVEAQHAQAALNGALKYKCKPAEDRPRKRVKKQDKDQEFIDGLASHKALLVLQCNASHLERIKDYVSEKTNLTVLGSVKRKARELVFLQGDQAAIKTATTELASDLHLRRALNQICVVSGETVLGESEATREAIRLLNGLSKAKVKVQTYPPGLQSSLTAALLKHCSNGVDLSPIDYTHVLSLIKIRDDEFMLGLSETDNYCIRNDTVLRSTDVPRAYFKLQEAFDRYGISDVVGKTAIDCGAAPGGWTRFLIEKGSTIVYSVDPGELSPSVLALEGVKHLKVKLQDAIPMLLQSKTEPLDIFVSDMCLHEMEAQVDLLLEAKPLLKPNALFVLTLKCVTGHSSASCDSQVKAAVARLDESAFGVKTMHLFVNRSRERTVMGYLK